MARDAGNASADMVDHVVDMAFVQNHGSNYVFRSNNVNIRLIHYGKMASGLGLWREMRVMPRLIWWIMLLIWRLCRIVVVTMYSGGEWFRPMARDAGDASADMVDHVVDMAFGQNRGKLLAEIMSTLAVPRPEAVSSINRTLKPYTDEVLVVLGIGGVKSLLACR
nr:patatin-like protein 6 [Tanacetum cinerariifolium]